MQKENIKFLDSVVFEGMTSIRAILKSIDAGTNDRKIIKILYDKDRLSKIHKEIGYLRAISEEMGFEIIPSTKEELDSITLGSSHGGIIAITGDRELPCFDENTEIEPCGFYAMIQGIEDPYNFGYSLRSLYAAGVDGVILTPRNWMNAAGVVARSSAGASELMDMYICEPLAAVEAFKSVGYKIVCAGIRDSVSIYDSDMKKPVFLIIGGEKRGISASVLKQADQIVRIDYDSKFRGSLSAASSAAIIGFEVMHQNKNM
jgi:23S rRNA (guanosine2251-2'-O)-methyltransferase